MSGYLPHPHHRSPDKAGEKSQWLISLIEEISVFNNACSAGWLFGQDGWGLYMAGNTAEYLGTAPDKRLLVFAKFIDSDNKDIWHGYPGDQRKFQDRPPIIVSRAWIEILGPSKVRKLKKGQSCVL